MATIASLAIDLTANSAKLVKELQRVNKKFDSFEDKVKQASSRINTALIGMFSVAAATKITNNILKVSGEFETLKASLETVFGSQEAAALQFKRINEFASKTPFTIQEITEAAIRMKSLGLDPSIKSLESMGNTASSMGKPLMQFTEAVADAVTSQFTRLKDFGIGASKQGDNITFTFNQVKTVVKNNAADIQEYLLNIGNTKFAGSVQKQSETLNGVMSTLAGATDSLAAKFAEESGLAAAVKESAKAMTDFINQLTTGRKSIQQLEADIKRIEESTGKRGRNKPNAGSQSKEVEALRAQILEIQAEAGNVEAIQKMMSKIDEDIASAKIKAAQEKEASSNVRGQRGGGKSDGASSELERLIAEKDAYVSMIETIETEKATAKLDAQNAAAAILEEAETNKQSKLIEQNEKDYEKLREKYSTEEELLKENFIKDLATTEKFYDGKIGLESQKQNQLYKIRKKYLEDMEKLDKNKKKKETQFASSHFEGLLGGMAQYSTAATSVMKAFAVRDAIINAHAGAAKTMGAYPYPLNIGMAALHYVQAFAMVRSITSESNSTPSGGGGAAPSIAQETQAPEPTINAFQSSNDEAENVRTKTVHLNIQGIDDDRLLTKQQVRRIVDEINEETEANVRIVL